ncbi:DUF551 domain-containing protein [Acetobacter senegalensis]|uniref:DUF551 domain-containing protein n=1 Tax=Acetobacter senegalensis TaxID=446692 RepID=UPI001EE10403|nr:DUF551 domain-containing protein [Acetobacter senegalensis]MCG4273942.1 DUF551 domain-containing protein [Acetobacter senegalensis]
MTEPRIEAAITEMKRLFGAEECVDRAEWSACAETVLAAADAAAWRPTTDRPPSEPVLIMSQHGMAVAQWDAGIDGWRNEDTMYSPRYFTHWQPLPAPPAHEVHE